VNTNTNNQEPKVNYLVEDKNKFIIENYNWAKPFANFFPGIAGKFGVPMWIYYVSRAQAICSTGIRDKDHALLEFQSFNKALSSISKQAFRTIIKLEKNPSRPDNSQNGTIIYEPFQKTKNPNIRQRMIIKSAEITIEEENRDLGINFKVDYFPLVETRIPALIRKLTVINNTGEQIHFELADGISRFLCFGMNRHTFHVIARHIEGMINVILKPVKNATQLGMSKCGIFRLKQDPADIEIIKKLDGGNFYFSYLNDKTKKNTSSADLVTVVDPNLIFGEAANYDFPWTFEKNSIEKTKSSEQILFNQTPCAFTVFEYESVPHSEICLTSAIGYIKKDSLLPAFVSMVTKTEYIENKRRENIELIEEIKNKVFTVSSSSDFTEYIQQTFLDNVIRGGMPVAFDTTQGKSAFYIYSRQNGDLERDYHNIILEPTYFSQGTGHYRSVNQNRRNDTWFFPEIYDYNIFLFMNLIQTDGYNPLEVNEVSYSIQDMKGLQKSIVKLITDKKIQSELLSRMKDSFTPGQITMHLEDLGIKSKATLEKILIEILLHARENDIGGLHEGFWVDHWFYNVDLIDNFLSIYPDRLEELLIGRKNYTYYDDPDTILPRDQKYVIYGDKIRQYGAVYRDPEKEEFIARRRNEPAKVRTNYGKGKIYYTNLLEKLLCITANRISNLDPDGIALQMESDKPGWNDSMNGLPGILGSSICEALQLEKVCKFLRESLSELFPTGQEGIKRGKSKTAKKARKTNLSQGVPIYEELASFLKKLTLLLSQRMKDGTKGSFQYWDKSSLLKEQYRKKIKFGIGGKKVTMQSSEIQQFLTNSIAVLNEMFAPQNRSKLFNKNKIIYTYFENEVTSWKKNSKGAKNHLGFETVKASRFKQRPLKCFLEGPMHYLRVHPEKRGDTYSAVRNGPLWDTKLKSYKVCESLKDETFEIGRVHAWPSGWIENESLYAHMLFKYLLEILRSGLYDEFFEDIKTSIPPFLDPHVYGRSIFENVSFMVSSAYKYPEFHGRGFQPRLSGATSEMVTMWMIMVAGQHPFRYIEHKYPDGKDVQSGKRALILHLKPVLQGWLFTDKAEDAEFFSTQKWQNIKIKSNSFAFKFLGEIIVVYYNPLRKNTYGTNGVKIKSHTLTYKSGKTEKVIGEYLRAKYALAVRAKKVVRIDVELG
jgi:hypothetical protein